MTLYRLSIPYAFIADHARMTWRDVLFGIEHELIAAEAASELAAHRLVTDDDPSPALIELAALAKGESPAALVSALASAESPGDPEQTKRKWLYLVLSWLLHHRNELPDALAAVEEVYADFGYPERVARFVRYMPMIGPDLGSRALNEQRLIDEWQRYVAEEAREYR